MVFSFGFKEGDCEMAETGNSNPLKSEAEMYEDELLAWVSKFPDEWKPAVDSMVTRIIDLARDARNELELLDIFDVQAALQAAQRHAAQEQELSDRARPSDALVQELERLNQELAALPSAVSVGLEAAVAERRRELGDETRRLEVRRDGLKSLRDGIDASIERLAQREEEVDTLRTRISADEVTLRSLQVALGETLLRKKR